MLVEVELGELWQMKNETILGDFQTLVVSRSPFGQMPEGSLGALTM